MKTEQLIDKIIDLLRYADIPRGYIWAIYMAAKARLIGGKRKTNISISTNAENKENNES